MKFIVSALLFLASLILGPITLADEGMWTLNQFPVEQVKKKYKFEATPSWIQHVQLSSARLAGGCSGSFVSKNGLIMTNHHCAHSCIEQLSQSGKDYVAAGFYAKTLSDEVRCPEIEINKLVQITDVTSSIRKSTQGLKDKAYNDALKASMSKIEKDCSAGSEQVRCDVVTLYHGGQYNLYKYQRYQDVRLVFAPEFAAAFFGGDPDNFTFPRYDLDVSFLRVYENNHPLQTKDYFQWSKSGAQENDLSFVTGHPGQTSRLLTITELEFVRDVAQVQELILMSEYRGLLTEFQKRGEEQKRYSTSRLFSVENTLKATKGKHYALLNKEFFAKKVAAEKALRARVNSNPKWKKDYGSAWDEMDQAYKNYRNIYDQLNRIEWSTFSSKLFSIAKTLVRAADELPKDNEKRFREFTDSALPQLKQGLFSTAPIYDEFEIENLTFSLTKMREILGVDHPVVKKILGLKTPAEVATELVRGTRLKDVAVRKQLFEGKKEAIRSSSDAMIRLALLIDPFARELRKKYEDEIETHIKSAAEKVAQAQFAVYGSKTYPDATFTLRISYGQVRGYQQNGETVKPLTNFAGAFARHTGSEPFALPESWIKAKDQLNLQTPLNFCSTNDIIGGNSGSPVINKNAQIVGLIFDGNIQSLGGAYGFDESVNRAVAVHSSALIEALQKIYGAQRIVDDLTKE